MSFQSLVCVPPERLLLGPKQRIRTSRERRGSPVASRKGGSRKGGAPVKGKPRTSDKDLAKESKRQAPSSKPNSGKNFGGGSPPGSSGAGYGSR